MASNKDSLDGDNVNARSKNLPIGAKNIDRRVFLKAAVATGALSIACPNILRAAKPNETLNVACIGVGGMAGGAGVRHTETAKHTQVVGLCDVDANILGGEAKRNPRAKTFADYRRMLDAMGKDIDAVTVATPDHMHGPIALAAMDLGLHVYCQKPLAHNIAEVRAMTQMAAHKGVITQLGTQIHSYSEYRSAVAAVRDGAIGKVKEVHLWINASWSGPPEKRPDRADAVPAHLDWKLWQGVAPVRPFVNGLYVPYQWRRWKDYGGGTLGDMGCHILDPVFSSLDITTALSVHSTGPANFEETFAPGGRIEYEFAGTERTDGPLKLTWAEKFAPLEAAKPHLPEGGGLPKQGSIMIGDNGMLVLPHFSSGYIYRKGELVQAKVAGQPAANHQHLWLDACRGEGETTTPFSYAGPLTEAVLLGTIASNFKDQKLEWNSVEMQFTNSAEATALTRRQYAKDVSIPSLDT